SNGDACSHQSTLARLQRDRFGSVEVRTGVTAMSTMWQRQLFIQTLDSYIGERSKFRSSRRAIEIVSHTLIRIHVPHHTALNHARNAQGALKARVRHLLISLR